MKKFVTFCQFWTTSFFSHIINFGNSATLANRDVINDQQQNFWWLCWKSVHSLTVPLYSHWLDWRFFRRSAERGRKRSCRCLLLGGIWKGQESLNNFLVAMLDQRLVTVGWIPIPGSFEEIYRVLFIYDRYPVRYHICKNFKEILVLFLGCGLRSFTKQKRHTVFFGHIEPEFQSTLL